MKKNSLKDSHYSISFKKQRKSIVLFVCGFFILVMLAALPSVAVQARPSAWDRRQHEASAFPIHVWMPTHIPIRTQPPVKEPQKPQDPPQGWTNTPVTRIDLDDPTPAQAPDPTAAPISDDPPQTPDPTPTPTPTPSPSPTPSPTPTPTPSPTPTPTPSPTPKPNPTTPTQTSTHSSSNLAAINDGKWHGDSSWNIAPADNFQYDTSTTHNGAPTWRVEPGSSLGVDHDWGTLAVKPGDHIVMTVWIKTSGTPDTVPGRSGATVGMDIYGNYGGTWARIGALNSPGFVAIRGDTGDYGYPSDSTSWIVPWKSGWTQRTYDFTMPNLWWGDGGYNMPSHQVPKGALVAPQYICPWLMVSANYGSNQGTYTTWFSDFQLYINP